MVETLITLTLEGKKSIVSNHKRFKQDFGPGREDDGEPANKLNRPDDFNETFRGDTKEDFKIGIQLTKSSVRVSTRLGFRFCRVLALVCYFDILFFFFVFFFLYPAIKSINFLSTCYFITYMSLGYILLFM